MEFDHNELVNDSKRIGWFKAVLDECDLLGKTVLDAGCGHGILTRLALERGASKVYSVELSKMTIEVAKSNLKRFSDRIVFINDDVTSVEFPVSFDLILCEMIGNALFDENMHVIADKIKKHLKPGGIILPSQASLGLVTFPEDVPKILSSFDFNAFDLNKVSILHAEVSNDMQNINKIMFFVELRHGEHVLSTRSNETSWWLPIILDAKTLNSVNTSSVFNVKIDVGASSKHKGFWINGICLNSRICFEKGGDIASYDINWCRYFHVIRMFKTISNIKICINFENDFEISGCIFNIYESKDRSIHLHRVRIVTSDGYVSNITDHIICIYVAESIECSWRFIKQYRKQTIEIQYLTDINQDSWETFVTSSK